VPLKTFNPTSPGRRGATSRDFSDITKSRPEKSLTEPARKTGGRNAFGHATDQRKGGGHKQRYRQIDFRRDKDGVPARVAAIEYDPNRSAHIALLFYADGEKRYILAPRGLKVGTQVMSGPSAPPDPGNAMPLSAMPLGTIIHGIELTPGSGGQMCRSAGTEAQLVACEGEYATVLLPSGEMRLVLARCRATVGALGNEEHQNVIIGKAGRNRWLGKRPTVRGIAKNPVDHPMGGGAGRAKGHHPQSRTGVYAKGGKTRKRKNPTNLFIIRGRKR
jgi:large subunit ribosomal protein L2